MNLRKVNGFNFNDTSFFLYDVKYLKIANSILDFDPDSLHVRVH